MIVVITDYHCFIYIIFRHFFFLLFNVLLVFTASSALFKTLRDILEDPSQIANILATKLPQVAPFFVNYTVMHGIML